MISGDAVEAQQACATFNDQCGGIKGRVLGAFGKKRAFENLILGGSLLIATKRLLIKGIDETRRQEAARHYRRLMAVGCRRGDVAQWPRSLP